MLVVVIVIAILGTNLLLGFFVANTLGYGPQTVSELLTGIYKVPVGWTLRKLVTGNLSNEVRAQWAQQLGEFCCTAPNSAAADDHSSDESDSPEDPDDDDDMDDDPSLQEVSVENQNTSDSPADYLLLRQVMQFVQTSPVLLDELRFQWRYLPKIDTSSEAVSEPEKEGNRSTDDADEESMMGTDDSDAEVEDDRPTPIELWTKKRLVDALSQWTDYLESYEPTEVDWWLDWFKHWEQFAVAWRKHCTEVLAVGLVERLLHENQPEPEVVEEAPKSVKSAKLAPPPEVKKTKPKVNQSKQQWITSQYSRLVQSLFASSSRLKKAQLDLLDFTEKKVKAQWKPDVLAGGLSESLKSIFPLSPLLELQFDDEFKPNFLLIIFPDHRRLLNLDAGQLVSAAVDSALVRTFHQWQEDELLSGQWFVNNENWIVGFLNTDDATVQQKASWITRNLAKAQFASNDYGLQQTCSVAIVPIDESKSPVEELSAALGLLNRKHIVRRTGLGDSIWRINGKRLTAAAKDEVDVESLEIVLGFDGIAPKPDVPGLMDNIADDEGNEDW